MVLYIHVKLIDNNYDYQKTAKEHSNENVLHVCQTAISHTYLSTCAWTVAGIYREVFLTLFSAPSILLLPLYPPSFHHTAPLWLHRLVIGCVSHATSVEGAGFGRETEETRPPSNEIGNHKVIVYKLHIISS